VRLEESALSDLVGVRPFRRKENGRDGMVFSSTVLLLVAAGCAVLTVLFYQKMNFASRLRDMAEARLAETEAKVNELSERINDLSALDSLRQLEAAVIWKEYASPNLTLAYPAGYSVDKASASFPGLTIKNADSRIEIFRKKDFPGGERPLGLRAADASEAELDDYLPKTQTTTVLGPDSRIQPYDVWIFYRTGDEAAKATLERVAASIKVLK
jgi:hypothetical protein